MVRHHVHAFWSFPGVLEQVHRSEHIQDRLVCVQKNELWIIETYLSDRIPLHFTDRREQWHLILLPVLVLILGIITSRGTPRPEPIGNPLEGSRGLPPVCILNNPNVQGYEMFPVNALRINVRFDPRAGWYGAARTGLPDTEEHHLPDPGHRVRPESRAQNVTQNAYFGVPAEQVAFRVVSGPSIFQMNGVILH